MPAAWHITCRLPSQSPIARTPSERRLLARALMEEPGWSRLLAWSQPDDHLHLLVEGERAEAGAAARSAEVRSRWALSLQESWEPARIRPVEDARHLRNALLYVLNQHGRHGVSGDPLREASNLPDLLGLRVLGEWTRPLVRTAIPRLDRKDLLGLYGQTELSPPAEAEALEEAARSVAARDEVGGRHPESVAVRQAALVVGEELGLDRGQVAALLGFPGRLRPRGAVPAAYAEALRRQLSVRARLPPEPGL